MRRRPAPGRPPGRSRTAKGTAAGLAALLACSVLAAPHAAAAKPDLSGATIAEPRASRAEGGGVLVAFRVEGAFPEEVRERVHSGMTLTFRHRVDLLGRRVVPLFPRALVGRTLVTTTVRYDSLTRRYRLERRVRGKSWPKGQPPPDEVQRWSTTSEEEMEAWMSRLEDVELPEPPPRPDVEFKIRIRSELGRRFVWYLFPWDYAATAEFALEF